MNVEKEYTSARDFINRLFQSYSKDNENKQEVIEAYIVEILRLNKIFDYNAAFRQIVTSNESRYVPKFPTIKKVLLSNVISSNESEEKSIYVNFYVKYPNIDTEYQYCFITTPNNLQSNWEKQLKGVEAKGGTVTRVDGYKNLNGKLVEVVNDLIQPPEFFKDRLQKLFN